jgi:ABC-2 type transport system ATP-binding protein
LIGVRVPQVTPELRDRLKSLPDVALREPNAQTLELSCREVKTVLVDLIGVLNELQIELTNLEIREPNLERVFLHLTGRGLRD